MGRAPCCDKDGLKKGPWTPEEDQKLIDYIQKHGCGNWRTLPKNAGLQRCGKSCRLRWTNYLRPDIKRGRFSFEEEETIIQLHSILGNKWSAIAARLPGRTDNEIKNYWNTHIRKRLLRMGIDPVTHSPRLDLLDLSSILNSTLYNNSSQLNMSRLLGVQPFFNPELLRLATSFLSSSSSSQQRENQDPNFLLHNQNQVLCNNNTSQFQNQVFQTPNHQIQQVVPSGCTTFGTDEEAQLMEHINIEDQFTDFDDQWQQQQQQQQQQNEEQDHYVPDLQGYGYYDSNQTTIMSLPQSDNGNNNQNFSFASVLSTPSSSPTPMNSNSTYINGSGTEDERESYCSSINMLKFEIPDMLDVNHFM